MGAMDENPYRAPEEEGTGPQLEVSRLTKAVAVAFGCLFGLLVGAAVVAVLVLPPPVSGRRLD